MSTSQSLATPGTRLAKAKMVVCGEDGSAVYERKTTPECSEDGTAIPSVVKTESELCDIPRCIARQLPFWDSGLSCESYVSSSDASKASRVDGGLVDVYAEEQEQGKAQVVPFGMEV